MPNFEMELSRTYQIVVPADHPLSNHVDPLIFGKIDARLNDEVREVRLNTTPKSVHRHVSVIDPRPFYEGTEVSRPVIDSPTKHGIAGVREIEYVLSGEKITPNARTENSA